MHKRSLLIGAGLYAAALVAIALWPTNVDSGVDVTGTFVGRWLAGQGLDRGQSYALIEFWSNVLLYLPLGVLAMLLSPRVRWWHAVALALLLSGVFELLQAAFRPGRVPDPADVIANTLGAALGAASFVAVRALHRRRLDRSARGAQTDL